MKALPVAMFVVGLAVGGAVGPIVPGPGESAARDPEGAGVTGIGGVFFKADDPVELRSWYREHLGIDSGPHGADFFWRDSEDPDRFGRTVWTIFPRETGYFGPGGQELMVDYRVRDLDALLEELRAEGVEQVGEMEEYEYGKFAWILDGEGNRVELWEPADLSPAEYERMVRELRDGESANLRIP